MRLTIRAARLKGPVVSRPHMRLMTLSCRTMAAMSRFEAVVMMSMSTHGHNIPYNRCEDRRAVEGILVRSSAKASGSRPTPRITGDNPK